MRASPTPTPDPDPRPRPPTPTPDPDPDPDPGDAREDRIRIDQEPQLTGRPAGDVVQPLLAGRLRLERRSEQLPGGRHQQADGAVEDRPERRCQQAAADDRVDR